MKTQFIGRATWNVCLRVKRTCRASPDTSILVTQLADPHGAGGHGRLHRCATGLADELTPCEPSEAHADKDNNHQDHKCDEHAKRPGVSVRSRPTLPSRASNRLRVHSGTTNTEAHCCGDHHDRPGWSFTHTLS
jgi:hypothetical protein